MIASSGKAIVGERVSIIQHPNGDPQKVAVHDNKIVDFNDDFIHYVTNTMGGSSGSPVLNSTWELVALHHAALGNGNEVIPISSIVTFLNNLLQDESAATTNTIDPQIVSELLAGEPSPSIVVGPMALQDQPKPEQPKVNPDGTVSWQVPVTITLGGGGTLKTDGLPITTPSSGMVGEVPVVQSQLDNPDWLPHVWHWKPQREKSITVR